MYNHPEKLKLSKEINTEEAKHFGNLNNLGKDAPVISIPYNNARLNRKIIQSNELVDLVKKAKITLNVNQIKIFEDIVVELNKLYNQLDQLVVNISDNDSPQVIREKIKQKDRLEDEIKIKEDKLKIMAEQD